MKKFLKIFFIAISLTSLLFISLLIYLFSFVMGGHPHPDKKIREAEKEGKEIIVNPEKKWELIIVDEIDEEIE